MWGKAAIGAVGAGLLFVAMHNPAAAQEAVAGIRMCAEKTDDEDRLACFDTLAAAWSETEPRSDKTASTTEISTPADPLVYRVSDPDDMYVAPRKYIGKPVELRRMSCFHADVKEYRCISNGDLPLVVFTAEITPPSEKAAIEAECGEVKKVSSSSCRKTLRFVPGVINEDMLSGNNQRAVVLARTVEIVPTPPPQKKRRR
ncbi:MULTISPECIES: hypothetical protein [unclassified Chelatococcus]|uniref:hypothetical protein n=1 Tax=unclassified Chelatococcus TaxID=2638111 RepID=UPI001BCC8145|nr:MULTISPECIES: hypothetical protein [unclassified Chelatococcus]MBS7697854.1 hypothetical protein [Chelatococcus sp. YT9]MBX3559791.1 hypothetical protein [Chelatococcus sp.]